ncbi:MAG: PAS domain S-box protein [Pseudomonadota bacterium]
MPAPKSIARTFLLNTVIVIAVTIAVLGYLFIANERNHLSVMAAEDLAECTAMTKVALKNEVAIIISTIDHIRRELPEGDAAARTAAQQSVLRWINSIQLGRNQYVVVNTYDGTILAHFKTGNIGKNMWDFTDANGVKAVQEVTRAARQPDGGFVRYIGSIQPATGRPAEKITFAKSVPDWQWVIATGIYLDDIHAAVAKKRSARQNAFTPTILRSLVAMLLAVVIAAVFVHLTVGKIMVNLHTFTTFFKAATDSTTQIDPARLHFKEFQELAVTANLMITERIRAQEALQHHREELEKAVADRTAELQNEIDRHRVTTEELRQREATLASIFRAAPTGIGMVVHRVISRANDRLCEMTGYSREEMIGQNARMLYPSDEAYEYVGREKYLQIRATGTGTVETRWRRKNGEVIDVLLSSTPLDARDLSAGVTFTALDITASKNTLRDLKENEERYRQLFEMEMDAIFLIDRDSGAIIEVNAAAVELYGYSREELLTMKNTDLSAEPEKTRDATVSPKTTIPIRYHRAKDGARLPVEITARHFTWKGRPVHVAAIRDIRFRLDAEAEREKLQAQLLQAQKMEAIGTLAGGIAHDFNNLLMGILGRVSLMKADPGTPLSLGEHLDGINTCVTSATGLTKQLLGMARGGKYEVTPVDVNALAQESLTLFARTRKEINVVYKLAPDIGTVEADRTQLNQVLLNLFINAWQAMPGGGTISLQTALCSVDDTQAAPFQATTGRYVKIAVGDTGIGMDAGTLQRIFDPFFTTKEKGRGTGLGLASAYGIIKNHGGFITVESEVGVGSTLTLFLPASEKPVETPAADTGALATGHGLILLVDDEPVALDVGRQMLARLGYTVLTAADGQSAVDIFQNRSADINLVILDMIMPGMSGGETFDRLNAIDPKVRVILSSGYSIDGQATNILNKGCRGFLQKPFSLVDLSEKIQEILSEV